MVERLLEREKINNAGNYPETIALVLWGTDNIKTYGESLAQVGVGLGVGGRVQCGAKHIKLHAFRTKNKSL